MSASSALLSPDSMPPRAAEGPASALFGEALRRHVRSLVSAELIEQHRRRPFGRHGYELTAVLNYFRTSNISGKFALLALNAMGPYRVIALSGVRGAVPTWVSDAVYETVDEAEHAVFVLRVEALLAEQST